MKTKLSVISSMPLVNLQNIDKKSAFSCAQAGIVSIGDLLNQHVIEEFSSRTGIGALSAVDHIRKAEMACLEALFDIDDAHISSLSSMTVSELCMLTENTIRQLSSVSHEVAHKLRQDATTLVACLDQSIASELTVGQLVESKVFYDPFIENNAGDVWLVRDNVMPGAINAELAYAEDGVLICPGGDRASAREGTVIRLLNPVIVGNNDGDYLIEARMLFSGSDTNWGNYGVQAIVFRSQGNTPDNFLENCYKFQWSGNQIDLNTWSLEQRVNNQWQHLVESRDHPLPDGHWYKMAVDANGPEIVCKVDYEDGQGWREVIRHSTLDDQTVYSNGTIGLFCCWNYRPQYQLVDSYEVRKLNN